MSESEKPDTNYSRLRTVLCVLLVIGLMVGLRVVALDSDAYPRLSWSSALLTDEGFYIHNARNTVLFGHPQTDQFNNDLIMPLLNAVQVAVFRTFGVGAVQARSISVVLGLLTLPLFWDALRRAFGRRAAMWGTLFLGLDHVSLLYSRLALMDTPAAFVLVAGFWAWVRSGEQEAGSQGQCVWLAVCGLVLGLCYGVRGLGALVYIVPVWLLWREMRRAGTGEQKPGLGQRALPLACLLGGLGIALGGYVLVWYLPHRAELARVNHYYLFDQLVPHDLVAFGRNVGKGLFGDNRGVASYLLRHTPVQTCLAVVWLLGKFSLRSGLEEGARNAERGSDFLALWLLIFLVMMCCIGYAPSRYYVLFLPALSGLAGRTLSDVTFSLDVLSLRRYGACFASGLFSYHLFLSLLHHLGMGGYVLPAILGLLTTVGVIVGLTPRRMGLPALPKILPQLCLIVWAGLNGYWTCDWLGHLTYRQREADRWLAQNLPADSVLIGAVAPGLCLDNRFICVNSIEKLCNDQQPVERFAPAPRYVLILDDAWREPWWPRHYPQLIRPENRIHTFNGLLRPFFVIGVYRVGDQK